MAQLSCPRSPPPHCSPWGVVGGAGQAQTCSCSPTSAPAGTPPPKSQPTEKPTQDSLLARPRPTQPRPCPQSTPQPEGLTHLPTGKRLTAEVGGCLSRPKTKAPGEAGAGSAQSTLPHGGSTSGLARVGPWGPRGPSSSWLAGRGTALVRAWQSVASPGTEVQALRHEGDMVLIRAEPQAVSELTPWRLRGIWASQGGSGGLPTHGPVVRS